MGEEEMGVVMEGVGSGDASVRRLVRPFLSLSMGMWGVGCVKAKCLISRKKTIEVLYTLSQHLSRTIFGDYLESIVMSTNLSLPLEIQIQAQAQGIGIEERMKVKMGRRETAGRALEVCEVVSRVRARARGKEGGCGKKDGSVVDWGDVMSVLVTLGETEKERGKDGEDGDGWEEGVKRVMDLVRLCEFSLLPSHHLPSPTLLHPSPTPLPPLWSLPRPPFGKMTLRQRKSWLTKICISPTLDDPSGELLVDAIQARYERCITHEREGGQEEYADEHEHGNIWIQSPTIVMLLGAVASQFPASGLGDEKAKQRGRASLRELLSAAVSANSGGGRIDGENNTVGVILTTSTSGTMSMLSPAMQEIVLLAFVALLRDDGEREDIERIRKDVEFFAKGAKGYMKRVSFTRLPSQPLIIAD